MKRLVEIAILITLEDKEITNHCSGRYLTQYISDYKVQVTV